MRGEGQEFMAEASPLLTRPAGGCSLGTRGANATPLAVRVAFTLFVAVLVPYYWSFYGPANFLWVCDLALLLTVTAVWLDSRYLASMQLVAVLLPCLIWLTDFTLRLLTGHFLTSWTHYMFRDDIPLVIRALSLYHGWFPFFLVWLVWRLGYDGRAWIAQTLLTWLVLPICFFFTDPVRGINGVFGPVDTSGQHRQSWLSPGWWLILMMIVYPALVFFPTHLVLRWFFSKRLATHRGMP
jgi:hypothetical protein